jgi:hypothetical protein
MRRQATMDDPNDELHGLFGASAPTIRNLMVLCAPPSCWA